MNRIQQILSKAERDGTARRLESVDHSVAHDTSTGVLDAHMPIPRITHRQAPEDMPAPPAPPVAREELGSLGYVEPATTADVASNVALSPLLVAALQPLSSAAEH